MKNFNKKGQRLLAIGIVCLTFPLLFKEFFNIPDLLKGFLMGFGIVLETAGFIFMVRQKQNFCTKNS